MGLISNQQRNAFSPWRWRSGALVSIYSGGHAFFNAYQPGRNHNWNTHTSNRVAIPDGNLPPNSWMLPRTGGGMSMRTESSGTFTGNLIPTQPMTINLTGSSDFDATAALVVSMVAALTGSGDLEASIVGWLNAEVALTGTGDLEADMVATANAVVALSGTGSLEATISAFGDMTIDIVVTGTGLSTANVGSAVWGALASANNSTGSMGEKVNDAGSASNPWTEVIESGYTAAEILRLLAAIMAGKSSGGSTGAATVAFRDLGDTKDRVTAAVDGSGNRTTVTRDAT